MGSGKSTIGEIVHKKLKRTALINTDKIKWLLSDFKRGSRDDEINFRVLLQMCEAYLQQGINLIIPQGFWKERVRTFINLAKRYKAQIYIYHLDAPKLILLKRIKSREVSKDVRVPITKSRVLKNIQKWKQKKYLSGKLFETNNFSKQRTAREILEEVLNGVGTPAKGISES